MAVSEICVPTYRALIYRSETYLSPEFVPLRLRRRTNHPGPQISRLHCFADFVYCMQARLCQKGRLGAALKRTWERRIAYCKSFDMFSGWQCLRDGILCLCLQDIQQKSYGIRKSTRRVAS